MNLIVCPLAELDIALTARPSHVLSLLSPDAQAPNIETTNRLLLRFNDIVTPQEGLAPPSPADIETLIDFARTWRGPAPLLTHCWAGISRSTAAAFIIACLHHAPGAERELARLLRRAAPEATPNKLMIALADGILRRDGHMIQAIAAIGRGREAGYGTLFTLAWKGE
ncbi:MAG TPA: hypothetical protein VNC39_15025 [Acidocella sp.]|jgi:predicted protein tyrosine phosphatase|uniref:tyrosine phosphatase family protein n=1 Tax=Acidocella sp. TaxID=50710 RepID=UPI002C787AA4|nr:hypothetical protein [Acidocella sp.]HVE23281.1 hypothetical protein [Acidocella sp.]